MKKVVIRIIGQILSISIFVIVFLFSLFITYGYRYDFEENEVIQTSVIDICTIPEKANLYLDNEFNNDKSCQKLLGLDLGSHELEIKKEGYFNWSKDIYLDNENVSLYPNILLIPHPEFYTTTIFENNVDRMWVSPNQSKYVIYDESFDLIKIFSISGSKTYIWETPFYIEDITWIDNSNIVADTQNGRYTMNIKRGIWEPVNNIIIKLRKIKNDLTIEGNELFVKKNGEKIFITRYANSIQSAQYFYNKSNLLIVFDDKVTICDFDGENCHVIITKDSGSIVAHPYRSKKIVFIEGGDLKQIILSGPQFKSLDPIE